MLGLIEIIFSSIGVYGFFSQNLVCVILGLVGIVICDCIDTFIIGHNPTTIFLSCMFAIGVSIANKNPLYGFTIALCGENLIMSAITIFAIGVSFFKHHLRKDTLADIHENFDYDKFSELSNIVMKELGVETVDEAIEKTYSFYKEQGVDVEKVNLDESNKFMVLSKLVMLGLDCDDIDEAIRETKEFYSSQEDKENETI